MINTTVSAAPAISSIAELTEKHTDLTIHTGRVTKSYQSWVDFSVDVKSVAEATKKTQKEVLQAICPIGAPFEAFHATVRSLMSRAKKALMSAEDKAAADMKKAAKAKADAATETKTQA